MALHIFIAMMIDYSTDVGIASVRTTLESFYESSD